jgi:XRE family aerobic/anaerobic benzoate catabolism transcriptional regulator
MHVMSTDVLERGGGMDRRSLVRLGETVRSLRENLGLTRTELAVRSGISLRFLAQLEAGDGNISFLRLCRLARALGTEVSALTRSADRGEGRPPALLGMRGAGKSTIGKILAREMRIPFLELDDLVEAEAGMPLGQIFELQGEAYYRKLERDVLARHLSGGIRAVLAAGGGIVTEPETFALLKRETFTVWLKAAPRDHWVRVLGQGDRRPMRNRPEAMTDLERLWTARARLYAGADRIVETSGCSPEEAAREILSAYARSDSPGRERSTT